MNPSSSRIQNLSKVSQTLLTKDMLHWRTFDSLAEVHHALGPLLAHTGEDGLHGVGQVPSLPEGQNLGENV